MKKIIDVLNDTLVVLDFISNTTINYKKKKKKIEKMIEMYQKDPETFLEKYIDTEGII